ncbi:hypothetical protein AB0L48_15020 [Streptomyces flaveolus]|uniref:hypothetical protein n=1 Tax=Streptomyces flaveolus TaxID=67297 RepID=UPI00342E580B
MRLKKSVSWVYQSIFFVAYSHSSCSNSSFSASSWTSYRKSWGSRSRTARYASAAGLVLASGRWPR